MNVVSDLDVTFVSEISAWLYSFITYIETEDKAKDSMTKLMGVIRAAGEEGVVTSHVVEDTIEYVETKPAPFALAKEGDSDGRTRTGGSYHLLRTDHNHYKLKEGEIRHLTLRSASVIGMRSASVIGMSVGHACAASLAQEGLCGHTKLADFAVLELPNLTPIPTSA